MRGFTSRLNALSYSSALRSGWLLLRNVEARNHQESKLPNKWILGQVGGIYVDAQDNIWVFQRPRSLTDDEKAAALDPPRAKCCVPAPRCWSSTSRATS
jgi:hypothetical protein